MGGLFSHTHRTRRAKRSRIVSHALALVSLVAIVLIEALHDHDCAGEGCIPCLIMGWAYVLLFLCMGISLVRPLLGVLARVRPVVAAVLRMPEVIVVSPVRTALARRAQTPVTLRVCLLI